jgi:hypothetical protein
MDPQPHRRSVGLTDALALVAITAIGVWLGLALRPASTAIPPASGSTAQGSSPLARQTKAASNTAIADIAPRESNPATPTRQITTTVRAKPSAALPPADQPIQQTYAALAARGRAGDVAAALRLQKDLDTCRDARNAAAGYRSGSVAPGKSVDELARIDRIQQRTLSDLRRCEGVSRAQVLEAEDWLRQAALSGDPEAMLCNATFPAAGREDTLSPEWRRYTFRWRDEAPGMAERALFAGLPEAAGVLAAMYSPVPDVSFSASIGLIGDRPDLAYFYARIYRDHAATQWKAADQQAWDRRAARLDANTRMALDLQAAALEARIVFSAPMMKRASATGACTGQTMLAITPQ